MELLIVNAYRAFRSLRQDPRFVSLSSLALAAIVSGTVFYWLVEGLAPVDSLYFSDEAFSHLATAASPEIGVGHPYFALISAPDLVEAAVRSGRASEAAEATAGFEAFAQPGAPAWARALGARCRAISSDAAEAEQHFASALELHAATDRRFDRARTELLYGEFLRRERRRLEARKHLRTALETFEQMEVGSWAERAGGELRASGETARKRDPGTLAQLTPQELQIARLVAEGRSNKDVAAQLFLSPRTIDYHLRKVFMKLGITSRAELIREGVVGAGCSPPWRPSRTPRRASRRRRSRGRRTRAAP